MSKRIWSADELAEELRLVEAQRDDLLAACKALVAIEQTGKYGCSYCNGTHDADSGCPVFLAQKAIAKAEYREEKR